MLFQLRRVDNGDPCKTYICHEFQRTFKHPGNFKQHMASHNKTVLTAPTNHLTMKKPMPGLVKMVNEESSKNHVNSETVSEWPCPRV